MTILSRSNDTELTDFDLPAPINVPPEPRSEHANNVVALPKAKRKAQQVKAFDYSGLPSAVAKEAENIAMRIRDRVRVHNIETGKELLIIKKKLGHGKFGKWLEFHFGWKERTAQNYMNSATAFGSTPQVIDALPLSTIYKLAAPSTPVELRQSVIDEINRGETPDPKRIEKKIADRKTDARQSVNSDQNIHTSNPDTSPEIAILEEVLASLDAIAAVGVADEIRDGDEAQLPTIMLSHDLRAKRIVELLKRQFGIDFVQLRDDILETDYAALRTALQEG